MVIARPRAPANTAPPSPARNAERQKETSFKRATLDPTLVMPVWLSRMAASARPVLPRRRLLTNNAQTPKMARPMK